MKTKLQSQILWALGASAVLGAGFLLSRYVFFPLHGMMQWPFILFVFGLIVILVAAAADCRNTMLCTAGGYFLGFICGMLFNWDTYHPDRGPGVYTNNNWSIWMSVFLCAIALGILLDIIRKRRNK